MLAMKPSAVAVRVHTVRYVQENISLQYPQPRCLLLVEPAVCSSHVTPSIVSADMRSGAGHVEGKDPDADTGGRPGTPQSPGLTNDPRMTAAILPTLV